MWDIFHYELSQLSEKLYHEKIHTSLQYIIVV